ncbi:MAG TPA: FkbM family methyltransferase [Candidatus Acidoferrales bacterium]|nr:FkbM family methyltransferase [Candidatus Acidoferrales bacterium]
MIRTLKNRLVALGPDHWAVRAALHLAGLRAGWRLKFSGEAIEMRRGDRVLILPAREYVSVPMMFWYSRLYFETMIPSKRNGLEIWDYSKPEWQTYRRSGLQFFMPALPEDDMMEAYVRFCRPTPGDIVWDVGAHSGVSSYFFSQLVGPSGKVYAFEPDAFNHQCLLRNLERYRLTNVIPVQKALAAKTGTAEFQMLGTTAAGLRESLPYPDAKGDYRQVQTQSLEDACREYGLPRYIKMDIEGAEVSVISASLDFLRRTPLEFAIESHHLVNNQLTYGTLDALFPQAGYESRSAIEKDLWYTWARPAGRIG